jgi:hypothetical protein
MGWRTETREAIRRCDGRAAAARADAQEAREFAAGLPGGPDRDAILRAAEDMDAAAQDLDAIAQRNRRTLDRRTLDRGAGREWSR